MSKSIWTCAGMVALTVLAAQAQPLRTPAAELPVAAPPPSAAPPGAQGSAPNLSTPGSGEITVTNPQAVACQDAAKRGDFDGAGVDQCTLALASAPQRDLAAIYTDRGAVYLQHKQYAQAKSDFDVALKLDPGTADAYIDRGAALLGMKQYAAAILDIDHGLSLGPDQPEKAYFNRAIADEHLQDPKAAYEDYLKASQLNPNWQAPKTELARFNR
ncbi:MAG TPA: tetratricopeptide repeat protein [Caulobacteraceae bacterium]|nr:tetratricopeptide repeat protein [Caulobacteraceae bacterium]